MISRETAKLLGEVLGTAFNQVVTAKGGLYGLAALLVGGTYAFIDYYDRPLQDRIHKRKIIKALIPPTLISGGLFFSWNVLQSTFSLLETERRRTTELDALVAKKDSEIASIRAEQRPRFKKSDFQFTLEAKPYAEDQYALQIEVDNKSIFTLDDYAVVLCIPGCKLSGVESMFLSRWRAHDEGHCRTTDSDGGSPIRKKWGLAFDRLVLKCDKDRQRAEAEVTFAPKDTSPFKYAIPLSLPPNGAASTK